MAAKDNPVKAEVWRLAPNGSKVAEKVEVHFNPSEYVFSKQVNWPRQHIRGKDLARLDFGGGEPATLTMQLFFDTYEKRKDVRDTTDKIWKMSMLDKDTINKKTQRGRPPLVKFVWGNMWTFNAVITSVSQRFTLFLPDGMPVRATLDVTFQQVEEASLKQNPTSGGGPPVKRRLVRPGDTLAGIAFEEYNDPTRWRVIAEANGLENPMRLLPGQELAIPPLICRLRSGQSSGPLRALTETQPVVN